jgi:AmmeMemoRadiSam system protein B
MARVQHSHLAGRWYPGDAGRLRDQVDAWLQEAKAARASSGRLHAVIVPHAGYQYSGRAAAAAYACVGHAAYRRAVIIAPSHFVAFRGVALLDVDAFGTPLGEIAVDRDAVAALAHGHVCRARPDAYRDEHSLEIQLPFLQRALPGVRVVPALLGHLDDEDYAPVAAAFAALADGDTLFVVSSDFVHYGRRFGYLPFPAENPAQVAAALRPLDMGAIELVCAGDAAGFIEYIEHTGATICGRTPIAVFLTLHRQRTPGTLLSYYTSLDVTGDYEHSVSYASIAFPEAVASEQ